MISIINYGMGNLGSVKNMLKYIGVPAEIIDTPEQILRAEKLLLPGVGAFGNAIALIDEKGFRHAILKKANEERTPLLGICLGMQLLTQDSEENEGVAGLGLIKAHTKKFNLEDKTLKVPHMGWNQIYTTKEHELVKDLPPSPRYYFVHSYYVVPENDSDILATCNYGQSFCCMVQKDNIYGAQFHPEKSHRFGMKLLENFAKL